jgi:hypothetical protein
MLPYADLPESANGRTFTPNITPVYDLNDDHFTPPEGSPPIRQRLKSPAERFNHVRVQFRNRSTQYATEIAEAKDETDISINGVRSAPIVNAPWVCLPGTAQRIAFNKMQRALHVCAEYEFALPWHFALLEPMDLVTLTDTTLELAQWPTRITVIEENSDGDLTVTSEDYPPGTANAALYPSDGGSGYKPDYNADPGNVAAPVIFELPTQLATDTGLQVAVAVRGVSANWGGAQVWCSLDGTNYELTGTVYGPARYGTLSSVFTTQVTVQGLGDTAFLLSTSAAAASALQTLCYVGGASPEYFAYQIAGLSGPGNYGLLGLVRGAYGTTVTPHTVGDPFVRVDDRVVRSQPLPLSLIGSTISFKFCSFNQFGGGQQGLSEVSAYSYAITGALARLPPGAVTGLAAGGGPGAGRITWTPNTEGDYSETELRLGASWAAGTLLARIKGSTYPWTIATAGSYTVWAKHLDALGNESTNAVSVVVTVDSLGTVIANSQNYGQNLLAESDQSVAVKFVGSSVGNGSAIQGPRYQSDEPSWDGTNYVLQAGRTRGVYVFQSNRHTGVITPDSDSLGNTAALDIVFDSWVPVVAQQRVCASVYVQQHRCRHRVYLAVYSATGVPLAFQFGAEGTSGADLANTLGNYERIHTILNSAPAGSAYMRMVIRKYNTEAGQTSSFSFLAAPQIEVLAPNAAGPSPYSPGPVGAIGTDQLLKNTTFDFPFVITPETSVVTVTEEMGFTGPVGAQIRRQQPTVSFNFTPQESGSLVVVYYGTFTVSTGATNGSGGAVIEMQSGLRVFPVGGATSTVQSKLRADRLAPNLSSQPLSQNITGRFDVVAGVQYTVQFGAAKLDSSITLTVAGQDLSALLNKR